MAAESVINEDIEKVSGIPYCLASPLGMLIVDIKLQKSFQNNGYRHFLDPILYLIK
jgi:hypothetical protein